MRRYGSFNLFAERDLRDQLEGRLEHLRAKVAGESENYLLNVSEEDYTAHLVSKYSLDNLDLDFDRVEASSREALVLAEHFSALFFVEPGQSYPRTAIAFHIPFQGDPDLLRCAPSSRVLWSISAWIDGADVCFELIDMSNDPEDINRESEATIRSIGQQLANVQREVAQYNSGLTTQVTQLIGKRKAEIKSKHGFLSAITVPLRRRDDLPSTFAVPAPKPPRRIEVRPAASEKAFKPEPTVDDAAYREILQVLFDVGKVFERLPATYAGKSEEDLRDHVLLYLEPRFAGSATGETFNRLGKTDILLRYENTNVFVAELKFWNGARSAVNAANQLFSYLTWRDSKTALVFFVRTKDFGATIQAARTALTQLDNFVCELPSVQETWFDFVFHLPGDPSRHLRVALLLFHLPGTS